MRSISGSVDTTTFGEGTASTASPLNTPGDDHPLNDPLLAATKRSLTASPSVFDTTSSNSNNGNNDKMTGNLHSATAAAAVNSAAAKNETLEGEEERTEGKMGVISRGRTAGGTLTSSSSTMNVGSDTRIQQQHQLQHSSTTPMHWAGSTSTTAASSSSSTTPSTPASAVLGGGHTTTAPSSSEGQQRPNGNTVSNVGRRESGVKK